jgi:hypothetical protein
MHVRHNDAALDSRSINYVDRSLEAHVRISKKFIQGIQNIFLATDNATVVAIASLQFPQFKWFTQQRPMSAKVGLYKMFTQVTEIFNSSKIDGKQVEEGHRISDKLDRNSAERIAYSVQKDLAHIMADIRFASHCDALVGSFDSRMTNFMHIVMCSMKGIKNDGKCPLAINILDSKGI